MTQSSKPYAHGLGRWRCRIKTLTGWRWCAGAEIQEKAHLIAQGGEACAQDRDPKAQDPEAQGDRDWNQWDQDREVRQPSQRTQPGGVRVQGPYRHAEGWRCRITSSTGRTWAATAATEDEAVRCAEKLAESTARQGSITIRDAIEAYVRGKQVAGARPATIDGTRRALCLYFEGMLDNAVGRLTPRRSQEQYDKLQEWVDPRSGRTLAVATHRSYLQHARSWGHWVVAKGWAKAPSALDVVKGVGRKNRGKSQLSLDEARRFYGAALDLARQGDEGAVAVLMAVSMGMRASEILSRTPRDLDDGANCSELATTWPSTLRPRTTRQRDPSRFRPTCSPS